MDESLQRDDSRYLNETFEEDLKYGMSEYLKGNLHTSLIAEVVQFYPETQTVDVQPLIKDIITRDDVNGVHTEIKLKSQLLNIPVHIPQGGGYFLTMPVTKGDECLIVFTERSIENWQEFGGVQEQGTRRQFDYNDALAIIGFNSKPNAIPAYNVAAPEIRNYAGDTKIGLSATGEINLASALAVNIVSQSTNIISPTITLTGNVVHTGNYTCTGIGTFGTDVVIGTTSFKLHTHPDPVSGNSGVPNP